MNHGSMHLLVAVSGLEVSIELPGRKRPEGSLFKFIVRWGKL